MKPQNILILGFAVFLIAGIALRELYVEPYPLIVLPAGAGVYEHRTDTISAGDWTATAFMEDDSATVPVDVLFPQSPAQYQKNMFSSLSKADTSSVEWDNTARWVRRNLSDYTEGAEVDSLCIHKVQHRVPIEGDGRETHYKRSYCYTL